MPIKLNVGVSRKVGTGDYGSLGASCNLEIELDAGQLDKDLDGFQARVRDVYVAAHQAVHDELARLRAHHDAGAERSSVARGTTSSPNGAAGKPENGSPKAHWRGVPRVRKAATPSQVKAILAIARRQNADLEGMLQEEFQVERCEDLTIAQASDLIDMLKAARETGGTN